MRHSCVGSILSVGGAGGAGTFKCMTLGHGVSDEISFARGSVVCGASCLEV